MQIADRHRPLTRHGLRHTYAAGQAINTLIDAQRACEKLYISEPEPALRIISLPKHTKEEKERSADTSCCALCRKSIGIAELPRSHPAKNSTCT